MGSQQDPRLRLLIVDDHQRPRQALARRLASNPAVSVVGDTGEAIEAHALVMAWEPQVVLVDSFRRDGQGDRLLASLAAHPPARRPLIVVHVSYFDAEHWHAARAAGADEFVLKRIGVDALVSTLLTCVRLTLPPERWPPLLHA